MARPGVNYPKILLHFGLTREAIHCVSKKIWKIIIPVTGGWASPSHRCHSPRRRGIQYAAPSRTPRGLGVLDRPPSPAMTPSMPRRFAPAKGSGPHHRVSVLAEEQDLPDPDLHRRSGRDELRPLAGLPLDRVDSVEADVGAYALRDQALDLLAALAAGEQEGDAGTERHYLDCDLVGVVGLQQIVGDAEHQSLLPGIAIGELQHDLVLGERLVLERHLLRESRWHRRPG